MTLRDAFPVESTTNAPERPVGLFDVLFVLVLGTLAGSAVMLAGGAAFVAALFLRGGHLAGKAQLSALLAGNFYFITGIMAVFYLVFLAVMWQRARVLGPRVFARFFPKVPFGQMVMGALSGLAVALTVPFLAESFFERFWHGPETFDHTALERAAMPHSWPELWIGIAVIAVLTPIVEEFFFRGFLLGWLRRFLPAALAAILSAIVFALMHGLLLTHAGLAGWVYTADIFVLGLVAAAWAITTGSLRPGAMAHFGYNSVVLALFFWAGR